MTGTVEALIDVPKTTPQPFETVQSQEKGKKSERTRWRQWLACVSATITMVAAGTVYGWTTTSLSRLTEGAADVPVKITDDESSWIVSLTVIGSMIGPFLGAWLADKFGSKKCLLLSSSFYIVGWSVVLLAKSVEALYAARLVLGVGVGVSYTSTPMYVSEVADIGIRGALGTLIAVNVFTGSLLTCSIGPWVSYHVLAMILLAVPIVFIAAFACFPETPHFLASKGRRGEATRSIAFFKGITDRDEARRELELVLRNVSSITEDAESRIDEDGMKKRSWLAKLRQMLLPNNFRAICIVLALVAAQQLSGNFSTMQYLEVLFKKAEVGIDSNVGTILVFAVGLISGAMATMTVEGAGRRPLLIISTLGSTVTLAILAVYLMLDERGTDVTSLNLLPVVDVIIFQVAYQIGLGTLPNALIGELFPSDAKAVAGAIVIVFDGILGFAVSKLYQVIGDLLGSYAVYFFFAGSSLLAFVLVIFFVPETKGRTFREIQELLLGDARVSHRRKTQEIGNA